MVPQKFFWVVFPFLFCVLPTMVKPQMQGCSIQGIELGQCLDQIRNSISMESCCTALNQALQTGFHCLCFLLETSAQLMASPLLLPLSNCLISLPPFTQCQAFVPQGLVQQPPATPVPVLLPPDSLEEELPLPSAPTCVLVCAPPQEVQVPLNTQDDNSTELPWPPPPPNDNAVPNLSVPTSGIVTSSEGHKTKLLLHLGLILVGTLPLCLS